MKKIIYLCGMMLLCLDMMAQIDPYDRNWDTIMFDGFSTPNRQFNNTFQEPLGRWISYSNAAWPSGVTKPTTNQVYQWGNCQFDAANEKFIIKCWYEPDSPIQCGDYDIAPLPGWYCDSSHQELFYYSGMIETPSPMFRYGFFEIRCKLPIHEGAFPAFWLYDEKSLDQPDPHYEEIDIFEFSWNIGQSPNWIGNSNPHGLPDPYTFTTGIYFNDHSPNYGSYARNFPTLPNGSLDLSHWHVFACEWMPDYVKWYCDGQLVNEFYDMEHIPHRPLTLKTNYAIDGQYDYNGIWTGLANMVVDYIKVYQLSWDCDDDIIICNQSDMDGFEFSVKNSVSIASVNENVRIIDTEKVTIRFTESFEVTGQFQVDNGAEFTVIQNSCPLD